MSIPIIDVERFGFEHSLSQVIIFGFDGKRTHVASWGETDEASAQAAAGANVIKKGWDWPIDTIAESAKVEALHARIAELERLLGAK